MSRPIPPTAHLPLTVRITPLVVRLAMPMSNCGCRPFPHGLVPPSPASGYLAPHPLQQQASPLQHCRTAIGATQVRRLLEAIEQGAPL